MAQAKPSFNGRGKPSGLADVFPMFDWLPTYSFGALSNDLLAAVIVTIMLIPQSLAYALLAGLPAEVGLYASILPLVAYAVFGTSRTLAVGPVAVVSLMTASAVGPIAARGDADPATVALLLAFMSGIILVAMGVLRLGLLASLLSHPVIAGFITASGLIIATSQLKHILGVDAHGQNIVSLLSSLLQNVANSNGMTLVIGAASIAFLFWSRTTLRTLLVRLRFPVRVADVIAKSAPIFAVAATTYVTAQYSLDQLGVKVVGDIPKGAPPFTVPSFDYALWQELVLAAVLISLVGFVESVSVAQTLAAKRRQRIVPDKELIGLGASNIAASFSGGYPVTGGFARSVVNFDAGAETPAAGAFTAVGILVAAMVLTPALYHLPKATLAATIIVAVLSLVDLGGLKRTWTYSRADFVSMAGTILVTLGFGVELGIVAGIVLSIVLHLVRTSRPHCAVVGLVPGTEHFRNIDRHEVRTSPLLVTLRVDESLYFPNARFLEDRIAALAADRPELKHVVLMCPAVNHIDASALESLESINRNLNDAGVQFHLSEVKGPVMDRLKRTHFLDDLTGKVFLSQFAAIQLLDPETAEAVSQA